MKRGLNVRQTCGAMSFYQRKMVYMLYYIDMNTELVTLRITINKILFLTTKIESLYLS